MTRGRFSTGRRTAGGGEQQESGRHPYDLGEKQLPELNKRMLEMTDRFGWKLVNGNQGGEGLLELTNLIFEKS